jgi:hypothetical protein
MQENGHVSCIFYKLTKIKLTTETKKVVVICQISISTQNLESCIKWRYCRQEKASILIIFTWLIGAAMFVCGANYPKLRIYDHVANFENCWNRDHYCGQDERKGEQTRLDEERANCWQSVTECCQINYVTSPSSCRGMQTRVLPACSSVCLEVGGSVWKIPISWFKQCVHFCKNTASWESWYVSPEMALHFCDKKDKDPRVAKLLILVGWFQPDWKALLDMSTSKFGYILDTQSQISISLFVNDPVWMQ